MWNIPNSFFWGKGRGVIRDQSIEGNKKIDNGKEGV